MATTKKTQTVVTVKPNAIDALSATQRKGVESASRAVMALEPNDAAIARAIKGAMTIKGYGFSGRGVASILAVSTDGAASPATVARLIQAGDAITGDDMPDLGDAGTAVVATLYRIACKGKRDDVTRARGLIVKSTSGDTAHTAVTGVYRAILAAAKTAAITPANRSTAGETADGGKPANVTGTPKSDADKETTADTTGNGAPLKSATVGSLIAELKRRVTRKGFTADAVMLAALEDLVSTIDVMTAETVTAE